jgi:FlaA1/EpsC-like NDP-sugar epimerase
MTGVDPALRADEAPALPRDGAGVPVTHRSYDGDALRFGRRPRHAAPESGTPRVRWHRPDRPSAGTLAAAATDWTLWVIAAQWAAACRYDFDPGRIAWLTVTTFGVQAGLAQVVVGHVAAVYRNRYPAGSFDEARMLCLSVLVVAGLCSAEVGWLRPDGLPRSLPALAAPAALVLIAGVRYVRRLAAERRGRPAAHAQRVLIYGAGRTGAQLALRMLRDPLSPFLPVGFVDDDRAKRNLRCGGLRVLGTRYTLPAAAGRTAATSVVIAIDGADAALVRGVCDLAAAAGLRCLVAPPLCQLGNGAGLAAVRQVDVADMIGRHPVDIDVAAVGRYLTGRRVLVTGAGGSIGSELCRQIHTFGPASLIMLDRDESALHAVQLTLYGHGLLDSPQIVLADIRDRTALEPIFVTLAPEVVFHAAALKHLPLLERYPMEAWNTNVLGTLNVLEAAAAAGVTSFVNISTDKAADPRSALGHSKRLGEQLTSWMSRRTGSPYLSVRFGNVLGSRGSVLHAFQAQIAAGGPVTVTDPQVSRYFMTVTEACQLVIQAGAIGRRGEALVLDMGEPVPIVEVARRMIAASGRPVDIVFTGLRAGEKLHESRLADGEDDARRVHPLISHVVVPPLRPQDLASQPWARGLFRTAEPGDGEPARPLLVGQVGQ